MFFKSYTVFSLNGLVLPFIITRMKQVTVSGILEWWIEVLSSYKEKITSGALFRTKLEKPTMAGNIVVVMLVGHALSLLVFSIETLFRKLIKHNSSKHSTPLCS